VCAAAVVVGFGSGSADEPVDDVREKRSRSAVASMERLKPQLMSSRARMKVAPERDWAK
jgi:hypothetical protein